MDVARPALLVALLCCLAAGQEGPGGTVTVELTARVPDGDDARLGYGRPRPVALETAAPRFLLEIPDFHAEDPLFLRLSLGETKGVPFYAALDRSPAGSHHDLLYVDRNRDMDLTNDGEPVRGNTRPRWGAPGTSLVEFLDLDLEVPFVIDGEEVRTPYRFLLYYFVERGRMPATVSVERDGWVEGTLQLGEERYTVALVDEDSDGQMSNGDSWVLHPASAPREALLSRDAVRSMQFPSWTADQATTVEVVSVDPAGRSVVLRPSPARETEREYFLRVARRTQSEEERRLDVDPLRRKAAPDRKVDWLVGKELQYALDIGRKVDKRVLVEFTADGCAWCARMAAYTFRDREVVDLCKRFVCAKLVHGPVAPASKRYGVDATPTYVVLDADGTEIARRSGWVKPREFAAWLKSALR